MSRDRMLTWLAGLGLAGLVLAPALVQAQTEVTFYYPVAVGGPITKIIDGLAVEFNRDNPQLRVKPIYSGTYQDSIAKALTAAKSGEPPVMSILSATDMFTLIDEDAIVPFDELVRTPEERSWLKSFYPGFMENSQTGGKTWGIPFQRSLTLMFWNKEMFRDAGLDPNRPPSTWTELLEYAQKLTRRDAAGNVTQWGIQIPSSGFPYWLFQAFVIQNGANLMNAAGTKTYFDRPEAIDALQFWVDLARKYKVHPEGIVDWGTTPRDFFERKMAMMWTTTGNLTNIRNNAKFDFGVALLPAGKRRGSATGGGNFYIFKGSTPAQRAAAFKFVQWVTTPERAAQWSRDTGYVAVRPDAFEVPAMKRYIEGFPAAAVARDELPFAKAEFSTHDNQRVTKVLNDALQAALTGTKTPQQAMKDAQREAERILRPYNQR